MNQLSTLISEYLRSLGFKKRTNSWGRKVGEFWQVVSLVKDYSWSARYSLSFGVFYDPFGQHEKFPNERHCHIRCGCQKLLGNDGDFFRYQVMDVSVAVDDRDPWVRKCLDEAMVFFEKSSDKNSLVQNYNDGYYKNTLFHNDLRYLLGLKGL